MKTLKQLLFIMIFVIGATVSASAQKNDRDQKTPPKENRPKIVVPDKKNDPPKEKPRGEDKNNDNRGRKPEMAFVSIVGEVESM